MSHITTIGFDLAKNIFQVHGVDAGQSRIRRQLRRGKVLRFFENLPACLVAMEACSSSHFWTRAVAVGRQRSGQGKGLQWPAQIKQDEARDRRKMRCA